MATETNYHFYDAMPAGYLSQHAVEYGLSDGVDVGKILGHIGFSPDSVLEVGAGEGRVVAALLARLPKVEIHALERSSGFLTFLSVRFNGIKNVHIIAGDLANASLPSVDVTLWLWSGIADFELEQQQAILSLLAQCTRRTIVLETPAEGAATVATRVEGQRLYFKAEWGTYCAHIPSEADLLAFAEAAQLHLRPSLPYSTTTGRARLLHFLDHLP